MKCGERKVIYVRVSADTHKRVIEASRRFDEKRSNNVNRMLNDLIEREYGGAKEDATQD